jgi:hypothetical protein
MALTKVIGQGIDSITVDSSGNVGIGTTSPSVKLTSQIASSGVSGIASTAAALFENSGDSDIVIAAGATSSSRIAFGDNGDWIAGRIDYDHSDNSMRFGTNLAANRMLIDSSGNVLIGTTSFAAGQDSKMIQPSQIFSSRNTTGAAGHMSFQNPNGGVGSITTSGSATAFNTSSDYRLKENVTADWDATTRLKQLNPVRFNFIAEPDTTVDGFLAHEVQTVVPEAITGTHNEVDDDGNAVMQGIDQSKLVPLLVKTIQELEARIAALENA